MESMTTMSGFAREMPAQIASIDVSVISDMDESPTPRRPARRKICSPDSSPDMYRAVFDCLAHCAQSCNNSVDLPMPGSPPKSMSAPGTSPPPSTRSTSGNVEGVRSADSGLHDDNGTASETFTAALFPRLPSLGCLNSVMVSHAPQFWHLPCHLEKSWPQLEH